MVRQKDMTQQQALDRTFQNAGASPLALTTRYDASKEDKNMSASAPPVLTRRRLDSNSRVIDACYDFLMNERDGMELYYSERWL